MNGWPTELIRWSPMHISSPSPSFVDRPTNSESTPQRNIVCMITTETGIETQQSCNHNKYCTLFALGRSHFFSNDPHKQLGTDRLPPSLRFREAAETVEALIAPTVVVAVAVRLSFSCWVSPSSNHRNVCAFLVAAGTGYCMAVVSLWSGELPPADPLPM